MFKLNTYTKLITLAILVPVATATAQEQGHGSRQLIQDIQAGTFRQVSPTFLNLTSFETLGETFAEGDIESGDFHRAQEPAETYKLRFKSHRYQKLKAASLYGGFSFTQGWDKGLALTEHLDSYRGNPYQVGDSLAGDWKTQRYNLALDFTTAPIIADRLFPGISVNYNVATGARQADPRPLASSNDLRIEPALLWKLNDKHFLGAKGVLGFYTEDLSLEVRNPNTSYNLYKMVGLVDVFDVQRITYVSGLSRNYKGKTFGGGLHYGYQFNGLTLAVAGNIHQRSEDVLDGVSNPLKAGRLDEKGYGAHAVALKRTSSAIHKLDINWNQYDRDGTEYHQRLVAASQQASQLYETVFKGVFASALQTDAKLGYTHMTLNQRSAPVWLFSASAGYYGLDSRYLYPQNKQIADVVQYQISAGHNWEGLTSSFYFNLNFSLQHKLTSELELAPAEGSAYIHEHLIKPDHAYITSSWIRPGFFASFSNRLSEQASWFVRASGSFLQPAKSDDAYLPKGTRQAFQLSFGIIH